MTKINFKCPNPKAVALQALKLAYEDSIPMGMGILHFTEGPLPSDIVSTFESNINKSNEICADYVKGRMMKLYLDIDNDGINGLNDVNVLYQSWGRKYPTLIDLLEAAKKSLS